MSLFRLCNSPVTATTRNNLFIYNKKEQIQVNLYLFIVVVSFGFRHLDR